MSDTSKAVFLSYASQDAEAAKRLCDALRAAGVEVWFDQSELVGGDAWDQKIRKQIKECALLIPIISANTQSRAEGYFRLEWRLADQRTHLMGRSKAFLLPVSIDGTTDADADVPDSFTAVQWTKAPGGEVTPAFCARVKKLLGGATESRGRSTEDRGQKTENREQRTENGRQGRPRWLMPVIGAVVVAVLALVISRPWEKRAPAAVAAAPVSEIDQLRARIVPDRWQKGDFEALSPLIDRILEKNPDAAEAWALRSIINSLQVLRLLDPGTKPLEVGKAAADHALRLSPNLARGHLALGLHLIANVSRGGDPRACRDSIDRAVAALPPDALTRFAQLVSYWLGYDMENTERFARAWLEAEPDATYPAWLLGNSYIARRRADDAEQWAERAAADPDITGVRALMNLMDARFYLRADLAGVRATAERIPLRYRTNARVIYWLWLLAMAESRWDDALQLLAQVPNSMLFDVAYNGPKALLVGLTHQRAGRNEAAAAQFREAERLLRENLAIDPDNEELRAALALTLASAGHAAKARAELSLVEPILRNRAPNLYRGRSVKVIAQTYATLNDAKEFAFWIRKLLAETSGTPYTPASLRLDPRYNEHLDSPEIATLLREFASLDQPKQTSSFAPFDKLRASEDASGKAIAPDAKSVAVLAFANLSDDKANEYFSDGISEELLNVLAKVPGLKVSARTSSFYFKGKEVPLPEIAQQLGVAYVVEGSVRRQGDKVRITAQLIKAADGFHVWSDTFTRDLKDIFAVQDEIAGLIAQQLQLKMGTTPAAREVNPEAHRLVLEGRHLWNLRTLEGFDRAEDAFRRAIALDPNYAAAHAGTALVIATRIAYRAYLGETPGSGEPLRAAARRALELDPALAEAWAALAYSYFSEGRFDESEQEYQKALALNPNSALLHHWHSLTLENSGRLDEALAEITRATELDPLSGIALITRERMAMYAARYAESLAMHERVIGLLPELEAAFGLQALCLLQLGRTGEAVEAARQVSPRTSMNRRIMVDAEIIHVLRQAGHHEEAEAYAAVILPRFAADSYQRGTVLAALGRFDEALPSLERTPPSVRYLFLWDPTWDAWRDKPAFQQLLAKLGFEQKYRIARATLARMQREAAAK